MCAKSSASSSSGSTDSIRENLEEIDSPYASTTMKRSKLLLTRLVPPSILRTQSNVRFRNGVEFRDRNSISGRERDRDVLQAAASAMNSLPNSVIVEQARAQLNIARDPCTHALGNGCVPTFFFHGSEAGIFGSVLGRRRSGDPPLRHLNISFGMVTPKTMPRRYVSNPRATGGLKSWYHAAVRQEVVAPRPPRSHQRLMLGNERLVRAPGGTVPGRTRKPLTGTGVPLVKHSSWARALGNSPRLIVVGDVHGCIDELRALLRLADYQPGDQVVFLGDLVAKGPDSVGVVQLAREIGARSVRGNHDHEVIRWFEAASRGGADAVVSLEHARIARALGDAEHAWLMDSPWFIESADMRHLFVHAGFIPGVKLTQQNPRLMMNMRSVLDDGTVTAKNVPNCAWARLWRGPQTVVFGHDAFRGLQQYEFAKGIDTGCVYGGRLTALLLPENRFVSVPAKRPYVSSKRFRTREAARKHAIKYLDGDQLDEMRYTGGVLDNET